MASVIAPGVSISHWYVAKEVLCNINVVNIRHPLQIPLFLSKIRLNDQITSKDH